MTALLTPSSSARPVPRPYRWTVQEFHDLMETGRFDGRRPILIDGEILEQGPMNPPHAIAVEIIDGVLRLHFGPGWRVRAQLPLPLGSDSDPHPDFAVLPGVPRGLGVTHPLSAPFVLEVADSSIGYDTGKKADLYAAAGVADYWVLDVVGRELHVFRTPDGRHYADRKLYSADDAVAPLLAPDKPVRVADLLP